MLSGRRYTNEYIRIVLGHRGEVSREGGIVRTGRVTVATGHYLGMTPALMTNNGST